jgi:hypothetical protein
MVSGMTIEVSFSPENGEINDKIDDAYRTKYSKSSYLAPMIGERARAATVKITPDD